MLFLEEDTGLWERGLLTSLSVFSTEKPSCKNPPLYGYYNQAHATRIRIKPWYRLTTSTIDFGLRLMLLKSITQKI